MRLRKIFHNGRELRAGWRLLLFCLLVFGVGYAMHFVVKRLPLPEYPGLHPVGIIVDDAVLLLIALAATDRDSRYCFRSTRNRARLLSFSPRDPKLSSEARAACSSASAFLSD
jgi:hypothetical protein